MPGDTVSPTSVPGVLGFMVLGVTILFMVLAVNSLLPRPGWLCKLFSGRDMRRRDFSGESCWAGRRGGNGLLDQPGSVRSSASGPVLSVPPLPPEFLHRPGSIPVLAWHQVVGGVARTSAEDVIWNYNKDCEPGCCRL